MLTRCSTWSIKVNRDSIQTRPTGHQRIKYSTRCSFVQGTHGKCVKGDLRAFWWGTFNKGHPLKSLRVPGDQLIFMNRPVKLLHRRRGRNWWSAYPNQFPWGPLHNTLHPPFPHTAAFYGPGIWSALYCPSRLFMWVLYSPVRCRGTFRSLDS